MEEEKRAFLERYSFLSWIFVIITASVIFYLSSLTFERIGVPSPMSYVYHFFIFFWLAFFLLMAVTRGKRFSLIFPALIIALAYAVSDEIHQKFVPFRACTFSDFLIDSAGILFAGLLYLATIKIRKKSII